MKTIRQKFMKSLFKNAFIKVVCLATFIAIAFNANAGPYDAASGNIALGKTVTPSGASAIVDGNTSTAWLNFGYQLPLPITITINLGANIDISFIRMYGGGIKNYKIEGSSGQSIAGLLTEDNGDAEFTILTKMNTNFIKFTILSATSYYGTRPISIGELGIFIAVPCPGSPAVCTSSLTVGGDATITGNLNVVGKITGAWGLNGTNYYYNGGNVGIGTTTPSANLNVYGTNGTTFTLGNPNNSNGSYSSLNFKTSADKDGYTSIQAIKSAGSAWGVIALNSNGGNVGIGTTIPDATLAVRGNIHAQEVRVDLSVPGPDYVFETPYKLPSLKEISDYIQQNKHLPEVPAASVMEANGINLGEMNMLLLKKVEELTLYLIEQNNQIKELKEQSALQSKQIEMLQSK